MFIRLTLEREGFETVSADGARPVYWCWIPATTWSSSICGYHAAW